MNRIKRQLLTIIVSIFIIICLFLISPFRSKISNTEKRNLLSFPAFTIKSFFNGEYTDNISKWFSDTVPLRDNILDIYFRVLDLRGIKPEERIIQIDNINENQMQHDNYNDKEKNNKIEKKDIGFDYELANRIATNAEPNTYTYSEENGEIYKLRSNLITFGKKDNLRVVEGFWGWGQGDEQYANVINEYNRRMPDVKISVMIVPSAIAFYCPDKYKNFSKPQDEYIAAMYSLLDGDINKINIYPILKAHEDEDIYFRTDHHWTPLGAYYAALQFASDVKVGFKDLSHYLKVVIKNFVGSMYSYTNDTMLKENPEDFIYYVPSEIQYFATRQQYSTMPNGEIVKYGDAVPSPFFYPEKNGSQNAYMTFMHGDANLTHVEMKGSSPTGRNLIIIKDSYGNAIPGYLFYGFDNIYVIDNRYFDEKIEDFASEHEITDILFVNSIVQTKNNIVSSNLIKYLK